VRAIPTPAAPGYLASKDAYDLHALKNADCGGDVMASFTIEDFSLNRCARDTGGDRRAVGGV